jgi:hypothetical protein
MNGEKRRRSMDLARKTGITFLLEEEGIPAVAGGGSGGLEKSR